MDIQIFVATHKKYWMPEDEMYIPLHVGREGKENMGYVGDETGDNISLKNPNYCELTGLYWMWKNIKCDYIGLCHYRRYFVGERTFRVNKNKEVAILSKEEALNILEEYDVIVPKARVLIGDTVLTEFCSGTHMHDLKCAVAIIKRRFPDYAVACDKVLSRHCEYMLNMFVMKKQLADEYCVWLFEILNELEKEIVITPRIFGFVSERLFNIWLRGRKLKIYENDVEYLEQEACNSNFIRKLGGKILRKLIRIYDGFMYD